MSFDPKSRCYVCRRGRYACGDLSQYGKYGLLVCSRCAVMLDAVHRFAEEAERQDDERQLPLVFTHRN